MKWKEAVGNYLNKWLLFEAIEACSKDGKRIIEDLTVVNEFDDIGDEGLLDYLFENFSD